MQTKIFINQQGSIENIGSYFREQYPGKQFFVICDENTFYVAGQKTVELLKTDNGNSDLMVLRENGEKRLEPDYRNVRKIPERLPEKNVIPVAVGSGTINDLVKRAAFEKKTPYVCIPTAASVDGYCSFGASLKVDGFKTTMECSAPEMVVADANILATAPAEMSSSGFGDLYSKHTAGIDWIAADIMGIEPINKDIWNLVHQNLPEWLKVPEKIGTKDEAALSGLFDGLCSTGFAMQLYGTSRPASGFEHLLSHVWEMNSTPDNEAVSHGFKVSVGILISTAITETLLTYPVGNLQPSKIKRRRETWDTRKSHIRRLFKEDTVRAQVERACENKWLQENELTEQVSVMQERWPEMKKRIETELIPFGKVKSDLEKAGCPVSLEGIGLDGRFLGDYVRQAQMIRDRFNLIDLIYNCGIIDEVIEKIQTRF